AWTSAHRRATTLRQAPGTATSVVCLARAPDSPLRRQCAGWPRSSAPLCNQTPAAPTGTMLAPQAIRPTQTTRWRSCPGAAHRPTVDRPGNTQGEPAQVLPLQTERQVAADVCGDSAP